MSFFMSASETDLKDKNTNQRVEKSSTKRKIYLYGGIFLILSIIIAIILLRKKFIRITGQIPYGWNKDLNYTLHDYIKTQPSRNILILTGGYQSGKSRSFSVLSKELKAGHSALVIQADFSTVFSEEDVLGILKIATYKGFSLLRAPSNYYQRIFGDLFPQSEYGDDNGLYPSYARAFSALSEDLDSMDKGNVGLSRFFNKLEKINEYLPVYVFINSLDNVYTYAPKYFEALFARFQKRTTYTDYVPIACELKDSSLRLLFKQDDISVRIVDTNGGVSDPKHDFVSKASAFRDDELKEVLKHFGNHGGMIERVFEDLKLGLTVEESIDLNQRKINQLATETISHLHPENVTFLCNNETTAVLTHDDISTYKALFSKGLISLTERMNFKFAHLGVRKAICGVPEETSKEL